MNLARVDDLDFDLAKSAPEDIGAGSEAIERKLDYELDRFAERTGTRVTINREARQHFVSFATSAEASWRANFRDLKGAVTRMATLAPAERITVETVQEEVAHLRRAWRAQRVEPAGDLLSEVLGEDVAERLDLFDPAHLAEVLRVCRVSQNLSQAKQGGRRCDSRDFPACCPGDQGEIRCPLPAFCKY